MKYENRLNAEHDMRMQLSKTVPDLNSPMQASSSAHYDTLR
jgi:hypothetical protein